MQFTSIILSNAEVSPGSWRIRVAGATAVQVGTANFIHPGVAQKIAEDMEAWLVAHKVADVKSLIGALEV